MAQSDGSVRVDANTTLLGESFFLEVNSQAEELF